MRRRLLPVLVLLASVFAVLPGGADPICDPLSDPNHAPTQWEYQCHQGARGTVPNVDDPTRKNPAARFTIAPAATVQPGDEVTFDGTTSATRDGRPMRDWVWDFGDGGQATGVVVTHAFRTPGQYIVALWVHDSIGWRGHSTKLVSVGALAANDAIDEELSIPSRHGVLHGHVTRPNAPGRFPVILTYGPYCPYGLGSGDKTFALIRSGYAFATVSAPGLCGSTGSFDMFGRATQEAGYDTIEWLGTRPDWSDGNVGLTGFSGPAVGAALTAGSRPPHLKAAAIMSTYADQYRDQIYPGGIPNSNTFVNAWRSLLLNDPALQGNDAARDALIENWRRNQQDMIDHPYFDAFWEERAIVEYPTPTAPMLIFGSNHDLWPRAQFELARWISPAGGRIIQCVGTHGCGDPSGYGSPEFLPAGGEARAWLDHFLKGVDNGVERRPKILTYAQHGGDIAGYGFDAGTWTALDSWPEDVSTWQNLYLDPTPSTGSIRTLTQAKPMTKPVQPLDIVPWAPTQGATRGNTQALADNAGGAESQQLDEAQTLTFETPAFDDDVRVIGPMVLNLYASVSRTQFGWSVQVDDVWPDGSANHISEGYLLSSHWPLDDEKSVKLRSGLIVRPYHPHTAQSVREMQANFPRLISIEVWGNGNVFRKGHRLRLSIAGENAGWRQRTDPNAVAPAIVWYDHINPSSLLLPVVPMSEDRDPHPFTLP